MFRNTNLKTRLISIFLLLSVIPIVLLSLLSLYFFSLNMHNQVSKQLISVRDIKRTQIIDYFNSLHQPILNFAERATTKDSLVQFNSSFRRLGDTIEEARSVAQKRYGANSNNPQNPEQPKIEMDRVSFARLMGPYGNSHRRFHANYNTMVSKSDFNDIFLADLDGNVVYSVKKEANYGSNLKTGPYAQSHLALAFEGALQMEVDVVGKSATQTEPSVHFQDFQIDPATEAVVSYLSAPVLQFGVVTGVLIFQLSPDKINALMGERAGLGDTGETYLVGQGLRMRSDSFLDPQNHSILASFQNPEIGKADSVFIQQGLAQKTGISQGRSYLGHEVLSAFSPLEIFGTSWTLIAEISEDEANAGVNDLQFILFLIALVSISTVVVIALFLSSSISLPVIRLTKITEEIATGDLEQNIELIDRQDELGSLAKSVTNMKEAIRDQIKLIEEKNAELAQKITVIEQQNLALQEADKLKDEFLANTSHELRTPINGIIGIAESMLEGATGALSDQQRNNLTMIVSSGKRLSSLVNDFLDFYKLRHSTLKIYPKQINLKGIIATAMDLSRHLIGSKPLYLLNQVDESIPPVLADEVRVEQILYNLISNAIKYTDKGQITIEALSKDDFVSVVVKDTGIGIPQNQQHRIFNPLEQGDGSIIRSHGGAGLGLSITKQLVELQGGEIFVESQEHHGSQFTFTLPISNNQSPQALSSSPEIYSPVYADRFIVPDVEKLQLTPPQVTLPNTVDTPQTILLVDDDPINLQVLLNYLALGQYKLITVSNGLDALESIKNDPPDLVLLDVMMPQMSGYQVCQIIRETYDLATLPVIMLTARNQLIDLVEGFHSGANDYLVKPVYKEELYARVRTQLQAKAAVDHLKENQELKKEIERRKAAEIQLERAHHRLAQILESAEDAIICLNEQGIITFFNQGAQRLFGFSVDEVLEQSIDLLFPQAFVDEFYQKVAQTNDQPKRDSLQLRGKHRYGHEFIADSFLSSFMLHDEMNIALILHRIHASEEEALPDNLSSESEVNQQILENKKKIFDLENALSEVKHYLQAGADSLLQQTPKETIRLSQPEKQQQQFRENIVDLMKKSVEYWEVGTGETKIELCEKSKLWKVTIDRSTVQCRTLNKYLSIHSIPQNPRWLDALKTAEFVLAYCPVDTPGKENLEEAIAKVQESVLLQKAS